MTVTLRDLPAGSEIYDEGMGPNVVVYRMPNGWAAWVVNYPWVSYIAIEIIYYRPDAPRFGYTTVNDYSWNEYPSWFPRFTDRRVRVLDSDEALLEVIGAVAQLAHPTWDRMSPNARHF